MLRRSHTIPGYYQYFMGSKCLLLKEGFPENCDELRSDGKQILVMQVYVHQGMYKLTLHGHLST